MIDLLILKLGLDGHDRGAKLLKTQLNELGFKVEYSGIRPTRKEVMKLITQLQPRVLGISIHSGSSIGHIADLLIELNQTEFSHLPILVGGVLSKKDSIKLLESGVSSIFLPGSNIKSIALELTKWCNKTLP